MRVLLEVLLIMLLVVVFSVGEFTGGFSAFLDVQNALVAEFYEVIHAIEQAQKIGFTSL